MIQETRTDEITTVAELYDYMERSGFKFRFYDNNDRDEVDFTIKDIQETNRALVLEATGLQPLLEQLAKKRLEQAEEEQAAIATNNTPLDELLEAMPDENNIEVEADNTATDYDFSEDAEDDDSTLAATIIRKDPKDA